MVNPINNKPESTKEVKPTTRKVEMRQEHAVEEPDRGFLAPHTALPLADSSPPALSLAESNVLMLGHWLEDKIQHYIDVSRGWEAWTSGEPGFCARANTC